jgi:hypothetical protein
VEEVVQLPQAGRVVDVGGVEDQRAGALVLGHVEVGDHGLDGVGQPALAAHDDRAVERGLVLAIPAQRGRVGQAEAAHELPTEAGPGKLLVAVSHDAPLLTCSGPHTPPAYS